MYLANGEGSAQSMFVVSRLVFLEELRGWTNAFTASETGPSPPCGQLCSTCLNTTSLRKFVVVANQFNTKAVSSSVSFPRLEFRLIFLDVEECRCLSEYIDSLFTSGERSIEAYGRKSTGEVRMRRAMNLPLSIAATNVDFRKSSTK
eukprot:m.126063 g.126063  ORF g.126063 m.126063 type:complete len:147 (-) comp12988_c6_seq2:754-1194(-)